MATNTIAAGMLSEFEQELGITRRFLERLPEQGLRWRAHEKSMTAGQLAMHLARVPKGVLNMAKEDVGALPDFREREQPGSVGEVLRVLEESAEFVRRTLPGISDARMQEELKVTKGGQTLMALPRVVFLRSIMLNHWYQHRGQFGVYLRLLGAIVPSSYGPSGDEERAGK
jgi:uncharacterized damage-inducible protein DinB